VLLRCTLPPGRVTSAIRKIDPMALVVCGGDVPHGTAERLVRAVRQADCGAPVYELSDSSRPPGTRAIRSVGPGTVEATRQLRSYAVKREELRPRANGRRQYAAG
jgi:hypothetical protein